VQVEIEGKIYIVVYVSDMSDMQTFGLRRL